MGIWVRSQNKALWHCQGFDISNRGGKPVYIDGIVNSQYEPTLGKFSDETRAMEVLDEIQRHIIFHEHDIACATTGEVYGNSYTDAVFEMPEE